MKKQWINILVVGLSLGTAWAVRGQFGHEQGAAWAGAAGAMALILVSKRKDWYAKILLISLASAVGWGAGGMISYGLVVGYGMSSNYFNAAYGLLMLFIIGSLFGLIGGGLTGMTLASSSERLVKWGYLIAEMVAGGLISYYLLVVQLEILMTPPRSEAWAVCFGAGLAMIWHMARNDLISPLRVAFYSAAGAGFGFAFGDFLQITGNVLGIHFNMWNVMEYSIGFFGGVSMAYAVFTSAWPQDSAKPADWENRVSYLIVFILIPFIVLLNTPLIRIPATDNGITGQGTRVTTSGNVISLILTITVIVAGWIRTFTPGRPPGRTEAMYLFILFLGLYIFLSYAVTGAFNGRFYLNHHLYVLNYLIIIFLMGKKFPSFYEYPANGIAGRKWFFSVLCLIALILILALIAVNIHGKINGVHDRFDLL